WRDIAMPSATDWIGVYASGAADANYVKRFYTGGRATDRTSAVLPADLVAGSYELRLFENDSMTRLATSNGFDVDARPSITAGAVSIAAGRTLSVSWADIA